MVEEFNFRGTGDAFSNPQRAETEIPSCKMWSAKPFCISLGTSAMLHRGNDKKCSSSKLNNFIIFMYYSHDQNKAIVEN